MRPDEAQQASGKRFAADLKEIREKRGCSLEAIFEETRVPMGLLEQFEQTALLDHEMFNRVYLRSFVRSYAGVVGLPEEDVLAALEEVFEGKYTGRLAETFLGRKPEAPDEVRREEPGAPPGNAEVTETPAGEGSARAETPKAPPGGAKKRGTSRKAEPEASEKAGGASPARAEQNPARRRAPGSMSASPPAARPAPVRRTPSSRRQREDEAGALALRLVAGAALIIILGALIYFFLVRVETEPEGSSTPAPVPADTVAAAAEAPPPPPPVLPDTMTVYLVAAGGPLEGIRVKVDADVRRPYWIEPGDSLRFRPAQRIAIWNRYRTPRLRINLEGYAYPVPPGDTLIVIDRATVQAFLNDRVR